MTLTNTYKFVRASASARKIKEHKKNLQSHLEVDEWLVPQYTWYVYNGILVSKSYTR